MCSRGDSRLSAVSEAARARASTRIAVPEHQRASSTTRQTHTRTMCAEKRSSALLKGREAASHHARCSIAIVASIAGAIGSEGAAGRGVGVCGAARGAGSRGFAIGHRNVLARRTGGARIAARHGGLPRRAGRAIGRGSSTRGRAILAGITGLAGVAHRCAAEGTADCQQSAKQHVRGQARA